jgi:hypothetical protein
MPPHNEQHPHNVGAPSAGLDQKPGFGNESNGLVIPGLADCRAGDDNLVAAARAERAA